MKKLFLLAMTLILGVSAIAQQKIQLRSADRAVCVRSDMTSLRASFSFSTIDAQDYESERGTFSWLSLPNTVLGGNEGDPQIPVINELIAVPFGANPSIEITSYSTTDYRLEDYGIHTLVPRQPSLRKDKRPDEVPFVYNASAYQSTRGLRSAPEAVVTVEGTMRGVRLGKMTIEPVSYDPVNNTIRVFNDIEVTVHFNGASRQATEQMLVDTYSPYFDIVYKSLFNGRAITSVYDDHPDLYSTPVKMLVVTTSTFTSSTAFQNWLTWKKQKGIDVDIYTVTSSTSASTIRSGIQSRYNTNHPSFLVIVGDESVVPYYSLWDYDSYYGTAATDLEYASVDSDIYHDMFISRMPVANTTQLGYLVDKILMYEKYTMSDPSYLDETLLIAGWDEPQSYYGTTYPSWTNIAGKPTIQYANNNYFNSAHGITPHVFITTATGQRTCYNYINNVGFINYTAHGNIQEWSDPSFTNSNVNSLTNTGKPFWAMGNCCLSASFSNTSTNPCFGEAMVRAQNKGAFGYIGSVVETYWYEDFYFGVGAFNASYSTNNNPTVSGTSVGAYDALFDDTGFNTLNSVPYIGNISVSYAYASNYTNSETDPCGPEYYWRCYQCFGDGSVMPYLKNPAANNVSFASTIPAGASSFRVNADARSYVSITVNNEIIGVAAVPANATYVDVPFTTTPQAGQTAMIVVTRNQRQPYINNNVQIVGGTEYTISANVSPANSGTVTGAGTYYENTECTLTATANHGYAFDNWKQGNTVVSTEPAYTFTVTGNATYTANFHALTEHHITYNPNQTNGTISVSPTDAYAGDIVTLMATPAAGYCLDQWHVTTGRAEIPVVNNQFEMPDSDVTITATFKSGYTITVATVANGTITANTTSALNGETITLTATPNTGCEFSTWYVYKTGDPSTLVAVVNNSFTMPSYDVTVSAVFATTTTGDVTIGSGTATNNGQYLPTYIYYEYSLTQQIYTAAEVGEAGTITAIAFQVSNNKAATRTLDIYMVPTTKDAFTSTTGWEVLSSVFKVYSGSVSFNASGWTTITLDTPFEYDGVKNLCVGVVDNTGTYLTSGNYPYFYTYSTGANRAMRVYNTSSAYNVGTSGQITGYTGTYVQYNNQIKLTKITKNNETLAVSPDAINDFSYLMGMGPSEAQAVSIVGADLSNDITVTAPTDFEVSTSATGTYSNSVTIPRATGSRGDRTVTSWGFEGSLDNWTAIDSDGDGYGWVLGSATSGVYLEEGSNVTDQVSGHNSSTDMMVSGSWTDATTTVLNPDNWLVSPQVSLGGSFSLWARPFYTTYFPEHFGIYVSTTSNTDVNSFTLLGEWTLGAEDYKQYSVDLHAYQGQSGYIAVRHFNCSDNFCILVDDFELDTDAAYNPDLPVTITSGTVYVRMKDNLNIGSYSGNLAVASGTLNKTVSLSGEVLPNGGEQYTITVNADPVAGGTVTGAGTYYEQSRVTLTATPATHYTFEGWQLNGTTVSTSASYQITVTGDATYTAVFTPMTQHNVVVNQATGGTITASPTTAYVGDVVTLTATTQSGYFFVEWNVMDGNSQTVTVTDNQFTMPDSDVIVTATFTTGYSITLNQTEHGTISADQTTQLQPGDVVTLTATPDNGCVFVAWYAYKTGNPRDVVAVISNQYILMPSSDVTVQAIFVTEEEHEANLGSGTNTNGYIPTYVRARYSLTQQIYLASELDNQKGRITKIAYRATTTAATRNLVIYMAHTDKSEFSSTTDWEVMGSVAKVFEGSVAFSTSGWTTITLTTPFEYDGTSNINICVVDVTNATAGSNSRYTQFYRYNGTNRALYANGTSSYANTVGYFDQLSSTTGTRISYVNQVHITMMVPGSAESLTLSPGEMADFSYVVNHGPSHTDKLDIVGVDLQNNITLNAPTNFEISLTEDGTYTSSLTVQRETGSSKGNRTITSWGFEEGLDGWTAVDADNDGYGWVLGSACGGVYLESGSSLTEGHTGTGLVVSGSYSNIAGELHPDNWLISPQVDLGGSFSMWAKAQMAAYPAEHFGIYVSTTGTNPSDFTLLDEWTLTSADWKQFSVDLGLYTGQQGYIAVHHFNGNNQFLILVDDFELDTEASISIEMPVVITPATVYVRMKENLNPGNYSGTLTGTAGTGNNLNGSVSLSGEVIAEYDITLTAVPSVGGNVRGTGSYAAGTEITVRAAANAGYTFINWTEDGTAVSTDAEYTFTVTANRNLVANFGIILPINGYGETSNPGGYYLIASPIGEVAPANVTNMTNESNTGFDLFYFDHTQNYEWINYKPGTGSTNAGFMLEPGKGYLYANKNTVDLIFHGQAYTTNNMEMEITLDRVETASTYNIDMPGWNLVGNPFNETAYIDIVSQERPFYTMNSGGTAFIPVTNPEIEPMQGIFVIAAEDGEKMHFSTNAPSKQGKGFALDLSEGGKLIDRAIVRFNKGRTLPKLQFRKGSTMVYIPVDGQDYAVVRAEEMGEMPVNFKAESNGTYSLNLSTDNVSFAYLHLIDNLTGADVDLLQTPSYSFEAKTTDYASRFKLVFATGDNSTSDTFAFFSNGSFVINNDGAATLQVIDVTGRILKSESINGCTNVNVNAAPGVYMLRLINGDNVKVQKVVVK
ncbi:MAG: choice-of-anchor J domain-containing protein [Muribaculaceae bacterium]|nr:choice-of-anchor J domain-containing protein [Muribaculaceae bacterium]